MTDLCVRDKTHERDEGVEHDGGQHDHEYHEQPNSDLFGIRCLVEPFQLERPEDHSVDSQDA